MEINNMKKLDLGKLASGNLKSGGLLKTKLNVSKGMEKIMVLKREEIKEIIKKMEEFYKKWEWALVCRPAHVGGSRGNIVNPGNYTKSLE
jgi:hypothetical protein